jgi:hypothetical protein
MGGDRVSDTDTLNRLLRLLAVNAHQAYLLSLGGNPSGRQRDTCEAMRNPKPGDVVLEISTFYRRSIEERNCVGVLDRIAMEEVDFPGDTREEILAQFDGVWPTERVWYLRGYDGNEHRWTNAAFIAVIEEQI